MNRIEPCTFCGIWTQIEPEGLCINCSEDSRKKEQIVREWKEYKQRAEAAEREVAELKEQVSRFVKMTESMDKDFNRYVASTNEVKCDACGEPITDEQPDIEAWGLHYEERIKELETEVERLKAFKDCATLGVGVMDGDKHIPTEKFFICPCCEMKQAALDNAESRIEELEARVKDLMEINNGNVNRYNKNVQDLQIALSAAREGLERIATDAEDCTDCNKCCQRLIAAQTLERMDNKQKGE